MHVILQENIKSLGQIGDQVTVKAGYARNFLIPKGKAVLATQENKAYVAARRAELEQAAAALLAAAQQRSDAIAALAVTLTANASEEGKLFGSIGPREIADAVTKAGENLTKSEVDMPEGPLRQIGEYDIAIKLHAEVSGSIKVNIVAAEEAAS